jgi:hypothetical protein
VQDAVGVGHFRHRLSAHEEAAHPLLCQGHFSRALQHFEQSIELYNPSEHGSLAYAVAIDRGVHSQRRSSTRKEHEVGNDGGNPVEL